jgi:hypothetical protein
MHKPEQNQHPVHLLLERRIRRQPLIPLAQQIVKVLGYVLCGLVTAAVDEEFKGLAQGLREEVVGGEGGG